MTSGEDEAVQAVTAGQEDGEAGPRVAAIFISDQEETISDQEETVTIGRVIDEDLQHFAEMYQTAQELELGKIDTALDAVEAADSREAAVAALTRATVGINAMYSDASSAPPEIISHGISFSRHPASAYSSFRLLNPQAKESDRKIGERLERYLKVANEMVEKYGPDQYQLSVGFPILISITLTWNTKK